MGYFIKHKSVANLEAPTAGEYDIDWYDSEHRRVLVGNYSTRQFAVDAIDGGHNYEVRTAEEQADWRYTPDNWKVVFILTGADRRAWRYREERRFTREDYKPVPWERLAGIKLDLAAVEEIARRDQDSDRYAHLSIKTPGKIAYTENEEHGYNDRQTVTTPARYLKKFFPDISIHQEAINAFVAAVTAGTQPPELKIARDADTIAAIYQNGPSSCMDGSHRFTVSPVRVYGDSDLGVVYIGDPRTKITARGVVWPDKLRYSRLYGDTYKLAIVLEAAGYTNGSMVGARIRRMDHPSKHGAIVIPYIDGIDGAEDTGDGYLKLGSGDISTSETCGYTYVPNAAPDPVTCQHCDAEFEGDPDVDVYCPACERQRSTCQGCSEDIWRDDDGTQFGVGYYGYDYCEYCYSENAEQCPSCGDDYVPRADHASMADRRATCRACRDNGRHPCGDCDTYVDSDEDYCEDCAADREGDENDQGDDTIDPVAVAETLVTTDAPTIRVIDPDNCATYTGRYYTVVRVSDSVDRTPCCVCHMDNPVGYGTIPAAVSGSGDFQAIVCACATLRGLYPQYCYVIVETLEPIPDGAIYGELNRTIRSLAGAC